MFYLQWNLINVSNVETNKTTMFRKKILIVNVMAAINLKTDTGNKKL